MWYNIGMGKMGKEHTFSSHDKLQMFFAGALLTASLWGGAEAYRNINKASKELNSFPAQKEATKLSHAQFKIDQVSSYLDYRSSRTKLRPVPHNVGIGLKVGPVRMLPGSEPAQYPRPSEAKSLLGEVISEIGDRGIKGKMG